MLKEINGQGKLYRIKRQIGSVHFVVTDSIQELARYCAAKEKGGWIISSVSEICSDGSTPRISVRSMPEYKKAKKEIMTFKEFQQTEAYKSADVIEAYNSDGREVIIRWLENHSHHIVVDCHTDGKVMQIIVD